MAHNLDITNGQASFVSARQDAWHSLGTVLPETFTAGEAMTHGRLGNWNVRKEEIFTIVNGQQLVVPDRYAVVRDNPVVQGLADVLGDVGKVYHVIQNEELAGLLDALVDESGAHFETAGAIDGGRRVFITMKMPGHLKVGGVDPVGQYLAAMTSHDGSMQTTLMVTPVRIVCQNTMNLAFSGASNMFKVRHTVGAQKLMLQQAREAMEFTYKYLEGFQSEAEQLINTTMTQMQFERIITDAFGVSEDAPLATQTRAQNKIDEMARLFSDSHTHEGVRDTAWAGLNALTEWNDHFSPVRGDAGSAVETRSKKALLDPTFKNKALRLMLAQV